MPTSPDGILKADFDPTRNLVSLLVSGSAWPVPGVQRTNLATNPSFELMASGTVATPVVRENLHPNPRYIGIDGKLGGGSASWPQSDFVGSGTASGDYDGRAYTVIDADTDQTGDVFIGTDSAANVPVTVGETYTFSCVANTSTTASITLSVVVSWRDAADAEISADIGAVDTLKGPWTRRSVTATAPANAASAQARLRIQMNPDGLTEGDRIRISMRMVEHTAVLRPYFDGDSGPGNGPFFEYLDAHWSGTVDASTSVLVPKGTAYPTTPRPLDFSSADAADSVLGGGGAQAVPSSFGAQSRTTSLAVVPNGSNADSRSDVGSTREIPLQPGATYTVSGTVTLAAVQEGTLTSRARTIVAVDSNDDGSGTAILATGVSAPNAAGSHRVSVTFTITPGRSLVHLRLYNGSDLSSDVVWWDNILIEAAPEARTFFYGDTPDDGGLQYSWTGEEDNSASVQEWMYPVPDQVTITRSVDGASPIPVRGAEMATAPGGTLVWSDNEAPLDASVVYTVEGYADGMLVGTSSVTISTTGAAWGAWIKVPGRPELTTRVTVNGAPTQARETLGGAWQIPGGPRISQSGSGALAQSAGMGALVADDLELTTYSPAELATLQRAVRQAPGQVLLIQTGEPEELPSGYYFVRAMTTINPAQSRSDYQPLRRTTLALTEAVMPAGPASGWTGVTYTDVTNAFATYQEIDDAGLSYMDLATGEGWG